MVIPQEQNRMYFKIEELSEKNPSSMGISPKVYPLRQHEINIFILGKRNYKQSKQPKNERNFLLD